MSHRQLRATTTDTGRPRLTRRRLPGTRPAKTAMLLAQTIVRDILDAGLQAGQMLPPERDMLTQYRVGRGTLRETLRYLEMHGVIAIKPGSGGGPAVATPDPKHMSSALGLILQFTRTPFRAIVELRAVIEPAIAERAALHTNATKLIELQDSVSRMSDLVGDAEAFLSENEQFHQVVAELAENELFTWLLASIRGMMDGSVLGVQYPDWSQKVVAKAHQAIYDAIADRDSERARHAMHDHLEQTSAYLERYYPSVLEQSVRWQAASL